MNTVKATSKDNSSDTTKLLSLLALATGAAAMPQTSSADIIWDNQGSNVSLEGNQSFIINNLPGGVQLGFRANQTGSTSATSIRFITAGKRGGGYLELKLAIMSQPGLLWGQVSGSTIVSSVEIASARYAQHGQESFNSYYMAFEFKDSSQAGSPMRYGWIKISLLNGNLITGGDFPKLTVSEWAYDNTGAQIPMGETVPEPGSASMLALGALTFGAAGVRSWRRNRAAASTNGPS